MAKKKTAWTPERRAAFGEKMKTLREAKLAKQAEADVATDINDMPFADEPATQTETPVAEHGGGIITPQVEALVAEMPTFKVSPEPTDSDKDKMIIKLQAELIEAMKLNQGNTIDRAAAVDEMQRFGANAGFGNGISVSAQGGVQGQVFKYPIDKGYYPDPTDRLYSDPALVRFALRENYIFTWDVTGETYEKNGITYSEPRFTVELYRRIYDDNGADTGQVARVSRQMQHEDEYIVTVLANKLGIAKDFASKEELMDEIRYRRIREWLVALFIPAKINKFKKRPRDMVIDGVVVEVLDTEDVISESSADSKASSLISRG